MRCRYRRKLLHGFRIRSTHSTDSAPPRRHPLLSRRRCHPAAVAILETGLGDHVNGPPIHMPSGSWGRTTRRYCARRLTQPAPGNRRSCSRSAFAYPWGDTPSQVHRHPNSAFVCQHENRYLCYHLAFVVTYRYFDCGPTLSNWPSLPSPESDGIAGSGPAFR